LLRELEFDLEIRVGVVVQREVRGKHRHDVVPNDGAGCVKRCQLVLSFSIRDGMRTGTRTGVSGIVCEWLEMKGDPRDRLPIQGDDTRHWHQSRVPAAEKKCSAHKKPDPQTAGPRRETKVTNFHT